ncbi:LamG domain-containing protein [Pseudocnuella soli]|uniref:LamG domain-containing protein n=1 Tax=Pseudocnuella soli TaxID=2502779 RepID=UPI001404DEF7|nr:LamG domain-containing protein [Pseudocnuella soli]
MKILHKAGLFVFALFATGAAITGCQKLDRPGMTDYPQDANPPGGPLKFYTAFDGTTSDPKMNAVDSVRVNFPADNPLAAIDGISGKGVQGESKKYIRYASFNDWAQSKSFTVSAWFKKNGQTTNNTGGNGPEYIFSLRSSDASYHWSNGIMFLFLEGNNNACAVKAMCVSPSDPANGNSSATDVWFTWENDQMIPGLLDNNWHHLALVYDEATSQMKLYIDGVQNPNVKSWANHGPIRLANLKIGEARIGRGPRNDSDGDGEGGWLQSSFKGGLDQFRLYGTALTAAEIGTIFTSKK